MSTVHENSNQKMKSTSVVQLTAFTKATAQSTALKLLLTFPVKMDCEEHLLHISGWCPQTACHQRSHSAGQTAAVAAGSRTVPGSAAGSASGPAGSGTAGAASVHLQVAWSLKPPRPERCAVQSATGLDPAVTALTLVASVLEQRLGTESSAAAPAPAVAAAAVAVAGCQ